MKKANLKKLLSVVLALAMVLGLVAVYDNHKTEAATTGIASITAVGAGSGNFLNGVNWDPAATSNHMTEVSTDMYEITYNDVAAGSYEFKFAANDGWDLSFGSGSAVDSGTVYDGYKGGNNCTLTVAETSNVTLKLDLTGYNTSDGSGAKFVVLVVPVEEAEHTSGSNVTMSVTHNVKNMSYSGVALKYELNRYITTLVPFPGYELPDSITVEVAGTGDLTQGTGYTYDSTTGEIVIKSGVNTGDVTITASSDDFPVYIVVGSGALTGGSAWNSALDGNEANYMSASSNKYVKEYADVAAGDYEFKVVKYTSPYTGAKWIGKDGGDANVTFTTRDTGSVTITYDPSANSITVDGEYIGEYTFKNMSIAGLETLFGAEWSPIAMTETSTGIWEYTISDVAAGTYKYKYTADNAWTHSWGNDGWYGSSENYSLTVPYSGSTVKFRVDLTDVDMSDPSAVRLTTATVTVTAPSYSVTLPTGNITATGSATATTGTNYTATLSPENGYGLPENITVTIGGNAYAGYTYNSGTGVVTIPGAAITGNIVISATGVELPDTYNVTLPTGNITATGNATATEGMDYTATLKPVAGYELPDTITVTIGGEAYTGFAYSKSTGVVTIPAAAVTGDIVISATAVKLPDVYDVTLPTGNIVATGNETVTENVEYTATLKAVEGYLLPDTITVTIGGEAYTGFTYSKSTGVVTIPAAAVTGDIVISATAVREEADTYSVTLPTDTNITATGSTTATEGVEYTVTLAAKDGYELPTTITVTVGGVACTDYTYSSETGVVTISAEAVTGAIVISATAVEVEEQGPDGSMEYPFTFTDKETSQPYTVLPGGTLYFNLDFDQFPEIEGKVLQIRHESAGFGGTPIQIQYGNPRLGMTTVSDGGEGDLDGEANGVIVHNIDLSKMQGFALYNQNPRANAYIDVDIVTFTPPAPGETVSSAVEIETLTKVETSLKEADFYDGNIFYYKYTADKAGFFFFWIDDIKKNGQSVDDIEANIYIESLEWSSDIVSEGKYNKNKDRVEAYVYLQEGEEIIIEVSTSSEFDMTTGTYPNCPAADITWSAELVEGTAEDPIIAPDDSFQFKFPAGVKVVFAGDFAQKLLTITNGLGGYEFDTDEDGEPEFITTEKIYVEYDGKKTEVDEDGKALVEIGGDRNSDVLVSVTIGEVEDRLGNFNVTITSLPADDKTVITEEDIEKLGATVENNAQGTELVIAPILWETFDRVESLVADTFKEKAYQMMDIKLVDENGQAVQPEQGKKVSITISLPEVIKAATKVAVSRYDEATSKLVAVATVDVVNGKITFATDHFSTYVFADATPASEDDSNVTPPVVTPDVPKTADMAPIAMVVLVAILAAAVVVLKKREVNE